MQIKCRTDLPSTCTESLPWWCELGLDGNVGRSYLIDIQATFFFPSSSFLGFFLFRFILNPTLSLSRFQVAKSLSMH